MEEAIRKLMEIEDAAREIMQETVQNKKWLSEQMEQACREYDAELDAEMEERLKELRESIGESTEEQLTKLREKNSRALENLEIYYEQNHERLSQELFEKILQY
ncbi:MAG: hypothetical protein KBT01_04080 [Clostridiales bacterium]|nr:hypothetical protein [Candidatus Blautia equi]